MRAITFPCSPPHNRLALQNNPYGTRCLDGTSEDGTSRTQYCLCCHLVQYSPKAQEPPHLPSWHLCIWADWVSTEVEDKKASMPCGPIHNQVHNFCFFVVQSEGTLHDTTIPWHHGSISHLLMKLTWSWLAPSTYYYAWSTLCFNRLDNILDEQCESHSHLVSYY